MSSQHPNLTNSYNWTTMVFFKIKQPLTAFLFVLLLTGFTACRGENNNTEKTMNQDIMDLPEILQVLFHPRATTKTQAPAGATNIDISVAPEVTIGCRLFGDNKKAPIILFFSRQR